MKRFPTSPWHKASFDRFLHQTLPSRSRTDCN